MIVCLFLLDPYRTSIARHVAAIGDVDLLAKHQKMSNAIDQKCRLPRLPRLPRRIWKKKHVTEAL